MDKVKCYWNTHGDAYCSKPANYVVVTPKQGVDQSLNEDRLYCLPHARKVFQEEVRYIDLEKGEAIAIVKLAVVANHTR